MKNYFKVLILIMMLLFIFVGCTPSEGGIIINGKNYDSDTIYAKLPSDWTNVTMQLGKETFKMKQDSDGIWYFKISNIGAKEIRFTSDTKTTELLHYEDSTKFFTYTGYNYKNELSGGFSDSFLSENIVKLSILELNDLHGYITQSSSWEAGISNAAYLIDKIRDEDNYNNTILVANGDMFQGTALSNLSHGLSVVKSMNAVGFDFMGVGNHEFDWGLTEILKYFDGDKTNGEADFPLVNSNILDKTTKELVSVENGNVKETLMIEKSGIKIGVVSLVGDIASSILSTEVENYVFQNVSECESKCIALKEAGADIILVNIHGGETSGVADYDYNQALAKMKYNDEWLVDAIINGHTHTNQYGYIERDGRDLPIVQGGSYCYNVGQIDLYMGIASKELYSSNCFTTSVYSVGKNYNDVVEDVVEEEYKKVKNELEEVYCVAGETVSYKNNLFTWSANIMKASTGCICGICNTGGLRSNGEITQNRNITLDNIYMINPFDDRIVVIEVTGKAIAKFLSRNSYVFYEFDDGYTLNSLANDNNKYKIAVIDYVYYWDQFPKGDNDIITDLILRDVMIADLRLRDTFTPSKDSKAKVGNLLNN